MKKTTNKPKLLLTSTTVRDLQPDQLDKVAGGQTWTTRSSCPLTSYTSGISF
jgi:hypothetical protein